MARDHYEALGVPLGSSLANIRIAYRTLAALYHPDKYSEASPSEQAAATMRMIELNEAMSVLGDVQRRSVYDRELKAQASLARRRRRTIRSFSSSFSPLSSTPHARTGSPATSVPRSPDIEKRIAVLRQRLHAVPLFWTILDSPGWTWSCESNEKGRPLLIAHQHFDLLEAKDVRALDRAIDRLLAARADKLRSAWLVVLLSCRRMTESPKVLSTIEDVVRHGRGWLKKRPMVLFYDDKSEHPLKFGDTPDHEQIGRVLKLLLNP
jgi:DnaJ-domain-containing protein 1